MTRPVLAATVAAVVLASGCGVRPEATARPLTDAEAPFGVLTRPTALPQPPGQGSQVLLFVRDAALVPVTRPALRVSAESALSDLLAGPTPQERADGLTTALPAGSAVGSAQVAVEGGVASVDVDGELLDSGRTDQLLALAQVVVTLDALEEVTAVRFVQDGEALAVPTGDGAVVEGALTADDYRELRAPA